MKQKGLLIRTSLLILTLLFSCEDPVEKQEYNRASMLNNISASCILPAYQSASSAAKDLKIAADTFYNNPNSINLDDLKLKYMSAYKAWMSVSVYEFGPASDNLLRASCNPFPVDTVVINSNISSGTWDLTSVANTNAKGFNALDFLLYRNSDVLPDYTSNTNFANRKSYLQALANQIYNDIKLVNNTWNSSYNSSFVNQTGTDVGSSTSLLVNALSFDLEISRRDRVGTPLGYVGLINSGYIFPEKSEAVFSGQSITMLAEHLKACKKLYNGNNGEGFDDYLRFIGADFNGTPLADEINKQFDITIQAVEAIQPDLKTALSSNKTKVEKAFVEIKKLVVLIKVDMSSQLGVTINYSDSDGD